jgi:Starch-binding associating with outer membrane
MNNRFKAYLYLFSICVLTGVVSCKKNTFNINDVNPNQPSDVSPKFILSGALKNAAAIVRGGDADYAELYMGYWAVSGDYIPVTQTLTYQTTTDYYSDNWNSGYLVLKNLNQMQLLASADVNAGFYTGMAKILSGFMYERIVDQYNDLPYSEALQGGVINFPKFDKAADVYDSVISLLNNGIADINTTLANSSAETPGNYDILFGPVSEGPNFVDVPTEMLEWKQFANTIKLKMALNESKSSGGAAFVQSALAGTTADGFLGAGQDAAVNPGYSNSSEAQQSPFYNDLGFSTSGAVQNNESYYRACDFIVNFMLSTNDTLRAYNMFAPNVNGVVEGRPFGSNVSVGQDNEHISGMGTGLLQTASSSAVILPATESLFMQAEATLDGYITGGTDAATLYQTAVEESFRLLEVPDATNAADAFLLANKNNANVGFANSTNQLQTLILQEWVAVSGFDPLASWNNWRRLGIPTNLPVSQFSGNVATHIPYRLLYPTSEYSYNQTNVGAEGTINNLTSKIFWMP